MVIHSDDWGSIRMPSEKVRVKLNEHSHIKADNGYTRFDTLASEEDLEALFEVLRSVKDKNNNHAVITANCLIANPDFEKIKDADFEKYYYETLEDTFMRYQKKEALNLWHQGHHEKLFVPQFHGREHVNVPFWLKLLQEGHKGVHYAFEQQVFGVDFFGLPRGQTNFQRAWDFFTPSEELEIKNIIIDGLNIFQKRFDMISRTVIAPNYTWSLIQENVLKNYGVKAMQGMLKQREPMDSIHEGYKYRHRFTDKKTIHSTNSYQRRNVFFEPSLKPNVDWLNQALGRINISFKMKKPAIISTHRINFIGSLVEENRNNNLKDFKLLLQGILRKWPDVEFMSAAELTTLEGYK